MWKTGLRFAVAMAVIGGASVPVSFAETAVSTERAGRTVETVQASDGSPDAQAAVLAKLCHKMMIVRVIDGDTVYGYIDTSDPIIAVRAKLRLRNIQSPENGRRAQCLEERAKGREAKQFLTSFLSPIIRKQSRRVARVCHLTKGKYALRRIGRLEVRYDGQWVDVSQLMLQSGMALPYFKPGSQQRRANGREMWCNCLRHGACPRV